MKTIDILKNQLGTTYKEDAEKCIKIYDKLKELNNGHVWDSEWNILTEYLSVGKYPNAIRCYQPSKIGVIFIKGIDAIKQQ